MTKTTGDSDDDDEGDEEQVQVMMTEDSGQCSADRTMTDGECDNISCEFVHFSDWFQRGIWGDSDRL